MGVMSTTNAGGTAPLISRKRGSVGQTARKKGKSLRLVVGFHEITTLHSYFSRWVHQNEENGDVHELCTHDKEAVRLHDWINQLGALQ